MNFSFRRSFGRYAHTRNGVQLMLTNIKKKVSALGVHPNTLRRWADSGQIKFIKSHSGQRRYDVNSFVGEEKEHETI